MGCSHNNSVSRFRNIFPRCSSGNSHFMSLVELSSCLRWSWNHCQSSSELQVQAKGLSKKKPFFSLSLFVTVYNNNQPCILMIAICGSMGFKASKAKYCKRFSLKSKMFRLFIDLKVSDSILTIPLPWRCKSVSPTKWMKTDFLIL